MKYQGKMLDQKYTLVVLNDCLIRLSPGYTWPFVTIISIRLVIHTPIYRGMYDGYNQPWPGLTGISAGVRLIGGWFENWSVGGGQRCHRHSRLTVPRCGSPAICAPCLDIIP